MIEREAMQRLIDGELSDSELRAVLQECESDASSWREVALRFVEDQQFRKGFSAGFAGSGWEGEVVSGTGSGPAWGTGIPDGMSVRWWMLAASLMVALAGGFWLGNQGSNGRVARRAAMEDPIASVPGASGNPESVADMGTRNRAEDPVAPPAATLVDYRPPDYHMQLRDANGNPVVEGEIPFYKETTARQIGYRMDSPPPVSPEVLETLRASGFRLNDRTRYISGRFDDGRQFVFPVRTISVTPGQ